VFSLRDLKFNFTTFVGRFITPETKEDSNVENMKKVEVLQNNVKLLSNQIKINKPSPLF